MRTVKTVNFIKIIYISQEFQYLGSTLCMYAASISPFNKNMIQLFKKKIICIE